MAEIGKETSQLHPTLLADFYKSGGIGAGDTWEPDPYKLEKSDVAEVEYFEIFSPVTAAGVIEDLKQVVPIIDDEAIEEYVSLSGRYDTNMMPPHKNLLGGMSPLQYDNRVLVFGTAGSTDPLRSTTLKAKTSISVKARAGTAVTQPFRIRVWGRLYRTEAQLKRVFGDTVYGEEVAMADMNRNVEVSFTKSEVEVTLDNWDMFSGGVRQSKPMVMPLVRYAYNADATTASVNYEFSYSDGEVAQRWENMYFDLDENAAIMVKGFGVNSVTNLKYMGVKIGDTEYPKPEMFRVDEYSNPLLYGHGKPLIPADFPGFFAIPTLPYGYLIHDEKGRIVVKDNGTSISANAIITAMHGVRVHL